MSDETRDSGRILTEAERQRARYQLLTTGQAAERLGKQNVTGDTVRSWCAAGWLRHVDGRKQGAKHPYYLIDEAWLEEFIEGGGAAPFVRDADAA